MNYLDADESILKKEKEKLEVLYNDFKRKNLKLDMSRGKPSKEQLEISEKMLDIISSASKCETEDGTDCRNYGLLEGIPEIRRLFARLLEVNPEQVIVGGNSSLNMMFDVVSCFMTNGVGLEKPWIKQKNIKFLCPVPGYDRHFSICEYYGIEMVPVQMTEAGPNMEQVKFLVENDNSIKGIWCVPKYSNPQGITYSDETVRRFAKLNPAAKDFRIFWDNAYAIHDINNTPDSLLSIMQECIKEHSEDMVILFCSTSKITFPGSGVAALAASDVNLKAIKERYIFQTIGYDKLNQLRHIRFFKDYNGMLDHMQKHKKILNPKFNAVLSILLNEFSDNKIITWVNPHGGYFISVDVLHGCAKRVIELCKKAGVILTEPGSTYPKKLDPKDSNIRLAPTYPNIKELKLAMSLFCICVKLAAIEKLLQS